MTKLKNQLNGSVKNGTVHNNNNNNGENGSKFFDPMSVTWTEKYNDQLTKFWTHVPNSLRQVIATIAVFAVGISINGQWLNVFVHVAKQIGYYNTTDARREPFNLSQISLESLYLKDLGSFWTYSLLISYLIYYLIGGFLHWYYYVRRRDSAEQWKIQPNKWLPPDLERHEILLGSLTLFFNATATSLLACYIANGGYSTVYYNVSDYGLAWFFIQFAVIFIYQDYVTYWLHRIYHMPFLYKHFHKLHHKYKQPTAFSVTAIHPVEALQIQATLCLPLFFLPVHWFPFYFVAFYNYYHGIIDHSGIDFKAQWWQPWQPDAVFHDNHHQYFHVNFAFNIEIWDKIHGTYRRKDRVYTENTFYGTGKDLKEASAEEIQADLEERESENKKAHRDVKNYLLSTDELQNITGGVTEITKNNLEERESENKEAHRDNKNCVLRSDELQNITGGVTQITKSRLEVRSVAIRKQKVVTTVTSTKVTKSNG